MSSLYYFMLFHNCLILHRTIVLNRFIVHFIHNFCKVQRVKQVKIGSALKLYVLLCVSIARAQGLTLKSHAQFHAEIQAL